MRYAKAITAALAAGLAAVVPALADDRVTTGEWVTIAGAVLVAGAAVWGVPNKPPPPV